MPGAWFFTRRDGSFAYVNLGAMLCEAVVGVLALTLFLVGSANDKTLWSTPLRSIGLGLVATGAVAWATLPLDRRLVTDRTRVQVAVARRAWAPLLGIGLLIYIASSI